MLVKLTTFLLLFPFTLAVIDPTKFLKKQKWDKFEILNNLLATYDKFQIIFHVDTSTKNGINNFLKTYQNRGLPPVIVYNHGAAATTPRSDEDWLLRRLNVVALSNPRNFTGYLKTSVDGTDVVIFLAQFHHLSSFDANFWSIPNLDRAGRVLTLNNMDVAVELYTVCFYCGNLTGRLIRLMKTSGDTVDTPRWTLMPRRFDDFNGHLLRVLYANYIPFVFCLDVQNNATCNVFVGIEYQLLKLLSEKLNFKFEMISAASSFHGLFAGLNEGVADFAIGGLTLTSERSKTFQFTKVLRWEAAVAIFKRQHRLLHSITTISQLFPFVVWVVLAFFVVLYAFLFYLTFRRIITFLQMLMRLGKLLVEQSVKRKVSSKTTKASGWLVTISWWVFCMILGITFKSRLSSFLIHPSQKSVEKIEDILNQGYRLVVDKDSVAGLSEMVNQDEAFRQARNSLAVVTNFCASMNYINEHKAAAIHEFSYLYFNGRLICPNNSYLADLSTYGRTSVGNFAQGWPFKVGAPFANIFDKYITNFYEGGFLQIWLKNAMYQKNMYLSFTAWTSKNNNNGLVNGELYTSQFALYCFGISLSIVCFVFEVIHDYCQKRVK